jgi:uncharacterized membrane protein YfcA
VTALALAPIVLLAFAVEAAAGFGATVVTVTLAAQLMPVDAILARLVPVNVLLSLYLVVRHRKALDLRLLFRRVLPWMGAGMAAGMAITRVASPEWVKLAFGLFVVVLSAFELWALWKGESKAPLGVATAGGALVGAGLVHGMFACGGPLVVWVVGREVDDKAVFRVTLSGLWLVLNVVLVVGYVLSRQTTPATLEESALLVPALAIGIVLGERVHDRLSPQRFRAVVFGLLFVAAGVLLVRSVPG